MAFDSKYYIEKKDKLMKKAQILQQEYLQNAFKFTNEIKDIEIEMQKIAEWEKENPIQDKKEVKQTPPKK